MKLLKKITAEEIKRMAIFFCVALFFLAILLKYLFLQPKVLASWSSENNLKSLINSYTNRIAVTSAINEEDLQKQLELLNKRFPKREEIPIVLDELEQLVKNMGVELTSLSEEGLWAPVEMEVKVLGGSYKFKYQLWVLSLNLSGSYINLANFLEAVDNWSRGVAIVKGFSMQKEEGATEKLKVNNLLIKIPIITDGNK